MSDPGAAAAPVVDAAGVAGTADRKPAVRRRSLPRPRLPGPPGLRRRILWSFTLGALGLASLLAITTYGLVRSNLLAQNDGAAIQQAYVNAGRASELMQSETQLSRITQGMQANGVRDFVVRYNNQFSFNSSALNENTIPAALKQRVIQDQRDARMIATVDGSRVIVVGINLLDNAYFESFSLDEATVTLNNVALSLALAATISTMLGVLVGALAARRAVRPVAAASEAAKSLASGHLDTRLATTEDPDLGALAQSFNDMAQTLQLRLERDARFASDVSHELRSPLMTLSASVEVMESRREEMPERAQAALDLLVSDVKRFRTLVEDLLEISRFDAGAVRLHMEELLVSQFVRNAVAVSSAGDLEVTAAPRAEAALISGDRRRLARVIANLIDNALAYAGEPTVSIEDASPADEPLTHIRIVVEDHGPGVPPEERALIFERFARGISAGRRTGSEGAGLGLALVDEHVRLHHGRVWVEDRSDGEPGARFVIELPAQSLDEGDDEDDVGSAYADELSAAGADGGTP